MVLFMGIMSRIVPASALNSAVPDMVDKGAYMSINSSLQQMAGGLAAIFAGLVVSQPSKTGPIENFNVLGYVMVVLVLLCVYLMGRVNTVVKRKQEATKAVNTDHTTNHD
jgi:predicted MFS family arabinose efflux permease